MALKQWHKTDEMATSIMKVGLFTQQRWQEKSQIVVKYCQGHGSLLNAKQVLLKFRLWTYLPPLRPHNCDKQITDGVQKKNLKNSPVLKTSVVIQHALTSFAGERNSSSKWSASSSCTIGSGLAVLSSNSRILTDDNSLGIVGMCSTCSRVSGVSSMPRLKETSTDRVKWVNKVLCIFAHLHNAFVKVTWLLWL